MTKKEALSILKPTERSEEALKKAYRAAARIYHPDHGGDVKLMQLVNLAYETLKGAFWTPYEGRAAAKESPLTEVLAKIWAKVAHLEGLKAEICGTWLWVSGDTRKFKSELKAAGFKWAPKKTKWYFHMDSGYRKRTKQEWGMDDIRNKYGSESLNVKYQPATA